MSEQRRTRAELRQGLHQFLMQIYMSYTETMSQDDAKKVILSVIEEQYEYFSPDSIAMSSTKQVLISRIQELTEKMDAAGDFDTEIYLAEKVDSLQTALDILDIDIR